MQPWWEKEGALNIYIQKFWLVVYEPPTPIQTLYKTEKLRNSWNMACINPRC